MALIPFAKPDVTFPDYPIIYWYIKSDYAKVETMEDFCEFIHRGLNEIETSQNEARRMAYIKIVFPLISVLTGRSYQSKLSAQDN